MRILIVEEGLRSLKGHFFQYLSDLKAGATAAGHDVTIICHSSADDEITSSLGAIPLLRRSALDEPRAVGAIGRVRQIASHNKSFSTDLSGWLDTQDTPFDLTVFTSFRLEHIWGISSLLDGKAAGKLGKVAALLIESQAVRKQNNNYDFSRSTIPLRASLRHIGNKASSKNLFFGAESPQMARQLKLFSGHDFFDVPHVTEMPHGVSSPRWSGDGPLVFATYGFTRFDKGLDILQSALLELTDEAIYTCHFILQWVKDYSLPDGSMVTKNESLEKRQNIEFIGRYDDSGSYYRDLARTHVIILPYRQNFYRDRMSRVAVDAAILGIPVIYPEGTWLSDFVSSEAAGVSFQSEDPASLAAAIQEACAHYPDLAKQAETRAESVRRNFSARTFFERLKEATHC